MSDDIGVWPAEPAGRNWKKIGGRAASAVALCAVVLGAYMRPVNGLSWRDHGPALERQAEDESLPLQDRVEAIVVMQRCTRAMKASLKRVQAKGGAAATHATNALGSFKDD